jgi:hypothetical protein
MLSMSSIKFYYSAVRLYKGASGHVITFVFRFPLKSAMVDYLRDVTDVPSTTNN